MNKVFQLKTTLLLAAALSLGCLPFPLLNPKPAVAATGPVKLCNGSVEEERINAAILYYNHEKKGWIAQGWYVIDPGKCALVTYYEGGMFVYAETVSKSRVWNGSGPGFCGRPSGFFGYQKTTCTKAEKFYQGIEIAVPSNGGGFNFTFGDPALVRDDF